MADPTIRAGRAPGQMWIESLCRYPVKSMLGETVDRLFVDESGAQGDRRLALLDAVTGHVASAKHARLWRGLLQCTARAEAGGVSIALPDGTRVAADDPAADELLSRLLGRAVRLISRRGPGATVERPDPELLLDLGLDTEVAGIVLEIGKATPGESFTDDAPLHAITTATLRHIGVEALRYRPNLVIATPPDYPPYDENDWAAAVLSVGEAQLRVIEATPRCVVPTLEHGELPLAPQALRTPGAENRFRTSGSDALRPCAGVYLEVVRPGVIAPGDPVTWSPAQTR